MSHSTWTGRTLNAWCDDCGKSWHTKSAHVVHVEIAQSVSYYPPGSKPK